MALQIKVEQSLAETAVTNWLDNKKVKQKEREQKQAFIDVLVDAVMYGNITIDETTWVITQTLDFPLTNPQGTTTLSELKYAPRGATGDLMGRTAGLKSLTMAVYIAYASALTKELIGTLNRLDTEDFKILQAITTFFL